MNPELLTLSEIEALKAGIAVGDAFITLVTIKRLCATVTALAAIGNRVANGDGILTRQFLLEIRQTMATLDGKAEGQ